MAQWLRAPDVLPEGPGSIPSTHIVAYRHLQLQILCPLLASWVPGKHIALRHNAGKIPIHIKKLERQIICSQKNCIDICQFRDFLVITRYINIYIDGNLSEINAYGCLCFHTWAQFVELFGKD